MPRHAIRCALLGLGDPAAPASMPGFASVRRVAAGGSRLLRDARFALASLRTAVGVPRAECDLIQVRDMVSIGLLVMLVARLRGIPFVYWMSFLMCEGRVQRARAQLAAGGGLRSRLILAKGLVEQVLLYRVVLRGASHVCVQSDAMKDYVAARAIPAARISAVPMGVDTELLDQQQGAARRLPADQGVPLIAYLGTLDHMRRLDLVIDALALVRQRHPAARLLLVGGSPDQADTDKLLAHAAALGLADAVHITGWMPGEQAWQLLRGADAAISYIPRGVMYDYSSPTKLLEYLALGIPSVGNDSPDQLHVLGRSEAGWLSGNTAPELAGVGVLAGVAIAGGWWMLRMWHTFG
ncbi:glycosyltransferase, partial [Duganella radicis]